MAMTFFERLTQRRVLTNNRRDVRTVCADCIYGHEVHCEDTLCCCICNENRLSGHRFRAKIYVRDTLSGYVSDYYNRIIEGKATAGITDLYKNKQDYYSVMIMVEERIKQYGRKQLQYGGKQSNICGHLQSRT